LVCCPTISCDNTCWKTLRKPSLNEERPRPSDAYLSEIRLIVIETQAWPAGAAETDALIERLPPNGFEIDQAHSAEPVLAVSRSLYPV